MSKVYKFKFFNGSEKFTENKDMFCMKIKRLAYAKKIRQLAAALFLIDWIAYMPGLGLGRTCPVSPPGPELAVTVVPLLSVFVVVLPEGHTKPSNMANMKCNIV